jgi:hypothetical protein
MLRTDTFISWACCYNLDTPLFVRKVNSIPMPEKKRRASILMSHQQMNVDQEKRGGPSHRIQRTDERK